LQHALYRAAKADPGRRFHALFDKVHRRDILQRAWEQVRRNRGASGIDQITLADVEPYGVARLVGELATDLKDGGYRPLPARRVFNTQASRPDRDLSESNWTTLRPPDLAMSRLLAWRPVRPRLGWHEFDGAGPARRRRPAAACQRR